jgi:DUF1680 family protein
MTTNHGSGRRQFLKSITAAAVAGYSTGVRTHSARAGQSETPSSREKLLTFRYSDVRLTGGPLKSQFDRVHTAYLALDEDSLLKELRVRAGLRAPGEFLGGWYDRDGFAPGHSFGQYISGLARFADATGDAATRAKTQRLVEGFAATIAPDGYSYFNQKASTRFPAYIYDKYVIGLLDADRFAGVSSALPTLDRVTAGAARYLPPRAIDRNLEPLKESPDDESYTLAENLFYAHEVTGNREYLEMAKKFLLNQTYFEPLARGENVLPARHAYSHANALSSAARAYQVLGGLKYLQACRNAWEMIERTQQFASGGWGPNESFVEPGKGLLGKSLTQTHAHFETPCGAYAHFKLARYLLRFTGESRYGDGLERVLYNTVLGAKDPDGQGRFFYYSDYHPAAQKRYFPDKWPCCSGTLPQAVADYLISAYFGSDDGIYVNLFAPSEVRWKVEGAPARLIQTTDYPASGQTELRLELASPAEFTVYVRVPGWLRSPAAVEVNGRRAAVEAEPGMFASLRRRWQNHDTIQVTLPFSFRTEAIDEQHPSTVALMWGPLMLVALDPELKLPGRALSSPDAMRRTAGASPSFEVQTLAEKLRFMPFYAVQEETYTTYLALS